MKINIQEIEKDPKNVFDSNFYDSLLEICEIIFPKAVTTDAQSNIWIKDKINIRLSLSWNEPKIYVYSFIAKDLDVDEFYKISRQNYVFRIFDLETMTNFLLIKGVENDFIKENEG